MTTTRLRKPIHNLTQTAYYLAVFLRNINPVDFSQILAQVRKEYAAPTESWFWFMFYRRDRISQLDATIVEINQNNPSIIQSVKQLLSEGGWEEASANTQLLRALLKKMPGYEPDITLSLAIITELKSLLFIAIEDQLNIESKISTEELRLQQIDLDRIALEKDLLKKQEVLLSKQDEIIEHECRLLEIEEDNLTKKDELLRLHRECTEKEYELQLFEKKLQEIEHERQVREQELEQARQKLLLLNPEIDIQKMSLSEIGSVMDEAKKIGTIAVKTYLTEHHEIKRKQQELESMRLQSANAKQKLIGKKIGPTIIAGDSSVEHQKLDKERSQRQNDVNAVCASRNKAKDTAVKSYLERFLKVQVAEKNIQGDLSRTEVEAKPNDTDKKQKAELTKSTDKQNAGSRSFHNVKIRPPQTKNENFLKMFSFIQENLKPKDIDAGMEVTAKPSSGSPISSSTRISSDKLTQIEATLFGRGAERREPDVVLSNQAATNSISVNK